MEARNLPVLIAANKIDMEESSPATLKSAFPQHPVVPISALTGYNSDNLYRMLQIYTLPGRCNKKILHLRLVFDQYLL